MLCRCCFLSPDAASRQYILGTHATCTSGLFMPVLQCGREIASLEQCLSASLFYFPSFQESGPAPEGTLEEVEVAEIAAMRKQVRWW